ncbi:MAG: peptidoglycan-binding protein [Rhodomicrobiaceae bacterium]
MNALYFQEAPQRAAGGAREALPETPPATAQQDTPRSVTAALPKSALEASDPVGATVQALENQSEPAEPWPLRQAPAPEPVSERVVQGIQRELARRGYDPGEANGRVEIETRSAIIAYEFDEGMPLTGVPSEAILKSLLFGLGEGLSEERTDERFERRRALVSEVQDMLARMGYGAPASDGRLDARTREAIEKFESDRNLAASGRLSARVLLEMVIVTGRPFNQTG